MRGSRVQESRPSTEINWRSTVKKDLQKMREESAAATALERQDSVEVRRIQGLNQSQDNFHNSKIASYLLFIGTSHYKSTTYIVVIFANIAQHRRYMTVHDSVQYAAYTFFMRH